MTVTIYNPASDYEKLNALKTFAAAVVDNLEPELTVVEALATRIFDASESVAEVHKNADAIIGNIRTTVRLIRYLSSLTDQRLIPPKSFDVCELLEELKPFLRRLIGETVTLDTLYARDVWPIEADPQSLELIILALSANARDAMLTGGNLTWSVKNIAMTPQHMEPAYGIPAADYVAIEVTDTGCGIPAHLISHIFEPFFSTKSGRGNGTGLTLVYGAINNMSGHILVESEVDKGTRFRMFVPQRARCSGVAV